MKKYTFRLIALMIAGSALTTWAAETCSADGECGTNDRRAAMLEKFDLDGDGQLSESERETARAARSQKGADGKGRRGKGRSGDKKGGRRGQMSAEKRQEILQAFDADGDGQLSEAERAEARQAHQAQRQASE